MTMTGARLKEILEDVADNLFNPDPYYQQGGDMVRCGGLGYTIDIGKPMGGRISALTHLKSGQPIDAAREYMVAGWASVNEGTEGPAGVGTGREIRGAEEDRAGRAEYVGEGGWRLNVVRAATNFGKIFPFSANCRTNDPCHGMAGRHGRHDRQKRPTRRGLLTAAGARALATARARRQSEEPAAQRARMDPRARRRRRGPRLRQALEARGACHPPRRAVADREPRSPRSASRRCTSSTASSRRAGCASSAITAASRRSTRTITG